MVRSRVPDRPASSSLDDGVVGFVRREIIALIVLTVVTGVGFMFTRAAAAAVRTLRLQDAETWYETGKQQLLAGRPHEAVQSLRRAAAIDHSDRRYQLQFATALAADRQDDAATQVLLRMRETTPEDPEVNAQLARLAARNKDFEEAVRHYENAVYGRWSGAEGDARRALRVELIRYLLEHQQRARALPELLILSGNLPDDAAALVEAGRLLLEAGEPQRALQQFQRALRAAPGNEGALAGAGEAAFAARDYSMAQRYLHAASSSSDDVPRLKATTDLILARDPMRPRLAMSERLTRAALNLTRARQALDECDAPPAARDDIGPYERESLQAEAALIESRLREAPARRDSTEAIEQVQELVYRIERQTVARCGGSTLDQALLLIGTRDQNERP